MYNYISKIGNISFGIFVGIALLTMLILTAYGGLMPDVLSKESDLRINFDVPMYFFNSTDRNRSYVKITYDKNNVDTTFGALEVSFTSSQNKPVGVKTSALVLDGLRSISFKAKADKQMPLLIVLEDKNHNFYYRARIELTESWQKYTLNRESFKPYRKEDSDPSVSPSITSSANPFTPYIEWAYPESSIRTTGRFYIDSLRLLR